MTKSKRSPFFFSLAVATILALGGLLSALPIESRARFGIAATSVIFCDGEYRVALTFTETPDFETVVWVRQQPPYEDYQCQVHGFAMYLAPLDDWNWPSHIYATIPGGQMFKHDWQLPITEGHHGTGGGEVRGYVDWVVSGNTITFAVPTDLAGCEGAVWCGFIALTYNGHTGGGETTAQPCVPVEPRTWGSIKTLYE